MLNSIFYYTTKINPITLHFVRSYLNLKCKKLKALIFVATTGRSGTASLAKIFENLPNCSSYHEPYPIMNKEILISKNQRKENSSVNVEKYYKYLKATYIRRSAIGARYYVETNHMFIKSFIDYAANDFSDKIKIIHLYRNPLDVANSIMSLGYLPGTKHGNEWYLDYRWFSNKIDISEELDNDAEFRDDFYKCLWYWYEIEERVKFWREKLPNVSFIDFNTDDLNHSEKLCKLFDQLELEYNKENIFNLAKTRQNKKNNLKRENLISKANAEIMHKKFQELLISKGYRIQ